MDFYRTEIRADLRLADRCVRDVSTIYPLVLLLTYSPSVSTQLNMAFSGMRTKGLNPNEHYDYVCFHDARLLQSLQTCR